MFFFFIKLIKLNETYLKNWIKIDLALIIYIINGYRK